MNRERFDCVLDLATPQEDPAAHHWVRGLRDAYDRLEPPGPFEYDGIRFMPVLGKPGMLTFWVFELQGVRDLMADHPGLELFRVEVSAEGQFNFPYEGEYKLYGAVVAWSRDYYASRTTISDSPFGGRYVEDYPSEWSLKFTAPSLKEALEFYIAVRSGRAEVRNAWINAADPTVAHPTPTPDPSDALDDTGSATGAGTTDKPVQNDLC